jgi:hypothetical protein
MAKVFGLHEIELRPGVRSEDFEKFVIEEVSRGPLLPGWEVMLLRGNRGERDGKYLLMFVIESVETRDRFFPGPDQVSEENQRFIESHPEFERMMEKWRKLASAPGEDEVVTDYVVVSS